MGIHDRGGPSFGTPDKKQAAEGRSIVRFPTRRKSRHKRQASRGETSILVLLDREVARFACFPFGQPHGLNVVFAVAWLIAQRSNDREKGIPGLETVDT